jgi:hypothetical protein
MTGEQRAGSWPAARKAAAMSATSWACRRASRQEECSMRARGVCVSKGEDEDEDEGEEEEGGEDGERCDRRGMMEG